MRNRICSWLLLGAMAHPVSAQLITLNNDMVYDTKRNLTWLRQANYAGSDPAFAAYSLVGSGVMQSDGIVAWLGFLDSTIGFNTTANPADAANHWRLPVAGNCGVGTACAAGELGELYSSEFGLTLGQRFVDSISPNRNLFTIPDYGPNGNNANFWIADIGSNPTQPGANFVSYFSNGFQTNAHHSTFAYYVWAVHDGKGPCVQGYQCDTANVTVGVAEVGVAYPMTSLAGTTTSDSLQDSGQLPPGMTVVADQVSGSLVLSGTPTQAGNYQFTVLGQSPSLVFSINVVEPIALVTSLLPEASEGNVYSATVTASGGATPYLWQIGALPAGVSYTVSQDTRSVMLSGTPQAGTAGTHSISFSVQDAANGITTPSLKLDLLISGGTPGPQSCSGSNPMKTAKPGKGEVNVAYPYTLLAGTLAGDSVLDANMLPPGMSLVADQSSGMLGLCGTPSQAGNFRFVIQGASKSRKFRMTILSQMEMTVPSLPLPEATEGVVYWAKFSVRGGDKPFQWSLSALPNGLTYEVSPKSDSVLLSGIPGAGTASNSAYIIDVSVTDPAHGMVSASMNLNVVTASSGDPTSAACQLSTARLNRRRQYMETGSITQVGQNFIDVAGKHIVLDVCSMTHGISQFQVGQTVSWRGPKVPGGIRGLDITVN